MKRKIAAALGIIMLTSSYASPFVHAEDPVEVTGTGSISTVDTSVKRVVVPTSKALDFTIDPQGLIGAAEKAKNDQGELQEGQVYEFDEADLAQFSGRVLGNSAFVFANKSLKDVTITTNFEVTGSKASTIAAAGKNDVDTAKANKNSAAKILFMAVPTSDAIDLEYTKDGSVDETLSSNADAKTINDLTASDFSGHTAAKGIVFTQAAKTTKMVLDKATVKYTYDGESTIDYKYDSATKLAAAGFVIAGYCNPYGDYSELGDLGVKASYTIDFAGSGEERDASNLKEGSYAVISAGSNATADWEQAPQNVVTSFAAATKENVLVSDGTVDIVVYDSKIAATDTVKLTPKKIAGTNTSAMEATDPTRFTVENGKVVIKKDWVSAIKAAGSRGKGTYTLKTTNSDSYVITIK